MQTSFGPDSGNVATPDVGLVIASENIVDHDIASCAYLLEVSEQATPWRARITDPYPTFSSFMNRTFVSYVWGAGEFTEVESYDAPRLETPWSCRVLTRGCEIFGGRPERLRGGERERLGAGGAAGRHSAARHLSGSMTVQAKLLELLVTKSYRRADTPCFRLASGKLSDFYIDCKMTTMHGQAMPLVGEAFARELPDGVDAVGGLTMGADPIAHAIAHYYALHGRSVNAFSVRKEPKKHGTRKWIEGDVEPGSKVVVVDDVVTTGGSTIDAIRRCREEGLYIVAVMALVDRQEAGAMEAIRREAGRDVSVRAIFTKSDLEGFFKSCCYADTP